MLNWFADRLAHQGSEVRKDERGFTLIELLVVVIIIGILAAIAIPTFLGQRERAQDASATSDLRNSATAMEAYFADSQDYTSANETDLEDIEPTIDFTIGGTAAKDAVNVASTTDPSTGNPGGYKLETVSQSGTTITLTKDSTNGELSISP